MRCFNGSAQQIAKQELLNCKCAFLLPPTLLHSILFISCPRLSFLLPPFLLLLHSSILGHRYAVVLLNQITPLSLSLSLPYPFRSSESLAKNGDFGILMAKKHTFMVLLIWQWRDGLCKVLSRAPFGLRARFRSPIGENYTLHARRGKSDTRIGR